MRVMVWVLVAGACSGGGTKGTDSGSDTGADTSDSGPPHTGWPGPTCPTTGDGRLDILGHGVDGVELGADLAAYEVVFGALDCQQPGLGEGFVCTDATGGFSVTFPDSDGDGVPDSNDLLDLNLIGVTATLRAPYDGTSTEGLGLGIDWRCFDQALGGAVGTDGAYTWEVAMSDDEILLSVAADSEGLVTEIELDYTYSE